MSVLWECYSSCCSILHFLKKMLQGHKDSQTFVDISSGSALGGLQEFKHMAVFSCMREWAVSEKSSLWLQNSLSHHKVLCFVFFFWPKSNLFSLYFLKQQQLFSWAGIVKYFTTFSDVLHTGSILIWGSRSDRLDVCLDLDRGKSVWLTTEMKAIFQASQETQNYDRFETQDYLNWVLSTVQHQYLRICKAEQIYKALSCYSDDIVLSQLLVSVR